jgi:5-methylcytosine-specific restriction endonuclease McrA
MAKRRTKSQCAPKREPVFPQATNWPPPQDQGSAVWWAWVQVYYASPEWKMRAKYKLRQEPVCGLCNRRPATDVHHLHYHRLGRELMCDLVTRCTHCHQTHHQLDRL